MPVLSAQKATSGVSFELKGTITPVTVLCLRSTALDVVEEELQARVASVPQMLANAPIVIDVADIEADLSALSLPRLLEGLRRCRLIPIGIAHLPPDHVTLAAEHGLAILQLGFGRTRGARATSPSVALAPEAPAPSSSTAAAPNAAHPNAAASAEPKPRGASHQDSPAPAPAAPAPPVEQPTMTLASPVRGGQVVYAQRTDLVVLSAVNPGAQVIADGHIHIYGRLMGRALAGAHGRPDARVFCQSLEAELVSVGGEFITADDIPQKLRGKPAQIFVEHGAVRVLPL